MPLFAKKLAIILAAFTLITQTRTKAKIIASASVIDNFTLPFKYIPFIYYQIYFKKNQAKIQALLDSSNEVNSIIAAFVAILSLKVWPTNIKIQKINNSILEIFEMILVSFEVENKLRKARFFQETFFTANTSILIIMNMSFLTFSNANVLFTEREFI